MKTSRRTLFKSAGALALAEGAQPPNVLFILSDDHTAADLGCYGNREVTTPNLDRLAAEGARFENCFVASPQCSPNRSAILTGCTPHTTSTSRLHTPLPDWEPTFLEPLKSRGYYAGAFRKVHQGAAFDRRWDFYGTAKEPFASFFDKLPQGRPFFLHLGFTEPHRPYRRGVFSPPHDAAKVRVPAFLPDLPEVREDLAMYYDFIARLDQQVGEVLSLLRARNLEQNTLVVFTGDNGMPFPRAKGTCYDPGIHVPLLVRFPGRVKPGAVHRDLISHVDFAPTFLELAGRQPAGKMQGRSFLPLLAGGSYSSRDAVYSERNWHDNFDPIRSVRTRRNKLIFNAAPHFPYRPAWDIEDGLAWQAIWKMRRRDLAYQHRQLFMPTRPILELYDLEKDPGEFHNLATEPSQAAVRAGLERKLSGWMEATLDYLPPAAAAPGTPAGRNWPNSL